MWHPRIAAVAVSFSLAVLLTIPHAAFGQHAPGVRMRGHIGGQVRGHVGGRVVRGGAFMRPPRLMGIPRGTVGPLAGPFNRGFADRGFNGGFRRRVSFPHHPGFFDFPGNSFGFFGFPHDQFGFFFFSGFGFFSGFPFFDSFLFDDFSRHRLGLLSVQPRPFGFSGFPHRRLGFFGRQPIPVGALLGWSPYLGTSTGYAYPNDSAGGTYSADTTTARDVSLGRELAVAGVGQATGDTLVVERVSLMDIVPRAVVRLMWRNAGLDAAQVVLFLADTAQGVLSAQTLRSPPFTALFEPPPGTAFAGMTVVWPDGTLSTRVVPYRRRPR